MSGARITSRLAVVAVAAMALLTLQGCGGNPPDGGETAATSTGAPLPATAAPPAVVDTSAEPVVATEVPGWQLVPSPMRDVTFQYVRTTHQEPFRPTVTIIVHRSQAPTVDAYAETARDYLLTSTPNMVVVAEQTMADQTPPLAKLVFQYERDEQQLQVMQLYFRRSNGQVVVVSFQSLVGQWEYLQQEFKQILSAIEVAP
ncbi:MAG: hypothetical protein GF320_01835 [Armatimonadia bacterium]|nr:hypothetical protein [Armatimonadia bacterium]